MAGDGSPEPLRRYVTRGSDSAVQHLFKSDEAADDVRARYRAHLRSWPVPNEHMTVSTREGDTFVVASGPESAPSVVPLHGTMSNAAAWSREVATWAQGPPYRSQREGH